ncbi:MAG: hypothetical protein ACJ73S_06345 [Mycobacteriales bacterium]
MVHTLTSLNRLHDFVDLVKHDLRVQVVFTLAPDPLGASARRAVAALDAAVIPWEQAVHLRFDLAIAASYSQLHRLHTPLLLAPHGAGYAKLAGRPANGGPPVPRDVVGLDRQRLLFDGRVIPSALVLSHYQQREMLGQTCPEALPVAVVLGDPSADQIAASRPHRPGYRRALGLDGGEKLVVAVSTWGRRSLLGQHPRLFPGLAAEAAAGGGFRVAAILHPNCWTVHGKWQIEAWFAEARRAGLLLIPPERGWQATLAAADAVIGDHGSVTLYAAALDIPIMLTSGFPHRDLSGAAAQRQLARLAPRLRTDRPLLPQLVTAVDGHRPGRYAPVAELITSEPGRFAEVARCQLYRMLRLPEPEEPAAQAIAPAPLVRGPD